MPNSGPYWSNSALGVRNAELRVRCALQVIATSLSALALNLAFLTGARFLTEKRAPVYGPAGATLGDPGPHGSCPAGHAVGLRNPAPTPISQVL